MSTMEKFVMLLINIPPFLGLLVWPIMQWVSIMFFDAPKATHIWWIWVIVFVILTYPYPVLLGFSKSWRACKSGDFLGCLRGTVLSYAGIILLVVVVGVVRLSR